MDSDINLNDFDLKKITNLDLEFYMETTNFLITQKACTECLRFSRMISMLGGPGFGKSNALTYFANNNANTYYVLVSESMSPRELLIKILEVMGFQNKHSSSSVYNLIQSIGYFLSTEAKKSLLIIDEAGRLSNKNLMNFHDLRNSLNKSAGIMFVGPFYFKSKIENMVRKNVQGIPELNSRINSWISLECPTLAEQAEYCFHRGILNKRIANSLIIRDQNLRKLKERIDEIGITVIEMLESKESNHSKNGLE
ncbi:AAA domain-containing protein [Mucilaginibacter lappiensis]|uniref:ORC1/DEAH AAA+ ATPase domain-containing protein n=1 Tax=Mucilaginibacter lappiensis TaxID=354630 RepID=A0ABR6PD34_9SPHI|nr:ATP-binding protein [Mucilaginibacter lappiensis]MBB6107666.1 hypothetical protein [Mucilaginibacter lappiensis]SIQ01126.1 AAA domain-containing protein [Mucilaginibacter lappiensis]